MCAVCDHCLDCLTIRASLYRSLSLSFSLKCAAFDTAQPMSAASWSAAECLIRSTVEILHLSSAGKHLFSDAYCQWPRSVKVNGLFNVVAMTLMMQSLGVIVGRTLRDGGSHILSSSSDAAQVP